jgi:hypothetical protein
MIYQAPELKFILLDQTDVLTTSGDGKQAFEGGITGFKTTKGSDTEVNMSRFNFR